MTPRYPDFVPKKKPLSQTFPDLAVEAHGWDPSEIHDLTNQKMQWRCIKGHIWLAYTYTRTGKKANGCPVCANRQLQKGFNDLESQHPELAKEADGWDPSEVISGTHKKLLWQCSNGHRWSASVANRVSGQGCPVCKGNKIQIGFNDLQTTNPDVAAEANGWDPTSVQSGTRAKLSWKCKQGHVWLASVYSRTGKSKTGCPYCSGRSVIVGLNDLKTLFPGIAEQAWGWDASKVSPGSSKRYEFRCPKGHLYSASIQDRTSRGGDCSVCQNKVVISGVNDLATTHPHVASEALGWDPKEVVAGSNRKLNWRCEFGHEWSTSPNHRTGRGQNCPYCTGVKVLVGVNDLQTTHPDLAREADGWDPKEFSAGSNQRVSWKCKEGHFWNTAISHRTGKGKTGCPFCSNHLVMPGFNDLGTLAPYLLTEVDGWDASRVLPGSNKRVAWKCSKGHRWKATVASRTSNKTGCPVCANLRVEIGFNDLATTHPDLAKEVHGWDPQTVTSGSTKKKQWKCQSDHVWMASVIKRTSAGTGCPSCAITGFDPNKDAWLYFLEHPIWQMQQIGITNVPNERLAAHRANGWDVKELRGPMDGQLARQWEKDILEMLRLSGANLGLTSVAGKFTGFTESWTINSFSSSGLRDLMDKVFEYETKRK